MIEPTRILEAHTTPIRGLAFDRTSTKLVAIDEARRLVLWSLHDGAVLATHQLHARSGLRDQLDFAPDGRVLASISDEVTLHDARSLEVLASAEAKSLDGYRGSHAFSGFGAGGELVLVGERLFDGRTLRLIAEAAVEVVPEVRWPFACIDPDGDGVLLADVPFDPTGRAEGPAERESYLTLFGPDLRTIRRRSFDSPEFVVVFDRASRRFVFARHGGELVAWTTDGKEEHVVARGLDPRVVYPMDAAIAVYPAGPKRLTLLWWRAGFEGEPIETDLPPARPSPDGRWLAWPVATTPGFNTPKVAIADISSLPLPR